MIIIGEKKCFLFDGCVGNNSKVLLDSSNQIRMNLRLPGQYYDGETENHYNYFRDYNPITARYSQRDPIGINGGINIYTYPSNPLSWIDPEGLSGRGGERGATGGQSGKGTDKPYKHCHEYKPPLKGWVECRNHQTGKKSKVPRPPEMPYYECNDFSATDLLLGGLAITVIIGAFIAAPVVASWLGLSLALSLA